MNKTIGDVIQVFLVEACVDRINWVYAQRENPSATDMMEELQDTARHLSRCAGMTSVHIIRGDKELLGEVYSNHRTIVVPAVENDGFGMWTFNDGKAIFVLAGYKNYFLHRLDNAEGGVPVEAA